MSFLPPKADCEDLFLLIVVVVLNYNFCCSVQSRKRARRMWQFRLSAILVHFNGLKLHSIYEFFVLELSVFNSCCRMTAFVCRLLCHWCNRYLGYFCFYSYCSYYFIFLWNHENVYGFASAALSLKLIQGIF